MFARIAFGALVALLLAVAPAAAAEPVAPGGTDLQTTLEKGLQARRPEEFAFISRVVAKVDEGMLPQSVVESTFLWARKKRQPNPFPYFRRGVETRARRLGVSL